MRVRVGTSGYQYDFWRGTLYTERCKKADMLSEYGQHLQSVEINNTFYRLPRREVVASWAAQVRDGFRFSVKASRRITHQRRLREVDEPVEYLLRSVAELGGKLGATLFQLPPTLRQDLPRLQALLELIDGRVRVAMEFRHESWFDESVYALLRVHDAALCISDEGEGESATPHVRTASWGYLRLRRESYEADALAQIAGRVLAEPWTEAYAYFKHEPTAAFDARRLQDLSQPGA